MQLVDRAANIQAQIDTLNKDYNSTSVVFVLANISRTVNETWFTSVGPDT